MLLDNFGCKLSGPFNFLHPPLPPPLVHGVIPILARSSVRNKSYWRVLLALSGTFLAVTNRIAGSWWFFWSILGRTKIVLPGLGGFFWPTLGRHKSWWLFLALFATNRTAGSWWPFSGPLLGNKSFMRFPHPGMKQPCRRLNSTWLQAILLWMAPRRFGTPRCGKLTLVCLRCISVKVRWAPAVGHMAVSTAPFFQNVPVHCQAYSHDVDSRLCGKSLKKACIQLGCSLVCGPWHTQGFQTILRIFGRFL